MLSKHPGPRIAVESESKWLVAPPDPWPPVWSVQLLALSPQPWKPPFPLRLPPGVPHTFPSLPPRP